MEPFDKCVLGDDGNYYCFPCGILKIQNEPKPLFNRNSDNPHSGNTGKIELELVYDHDGPFNCAMCGEYI